MPSDPANRSNRFLFRLSWSLGLTGAILPCSYRLSFANCGTVLFLISAIVCLSEEDRTRRKPESS
jgi:hypothetical protein